jgi:hypothetical protein
MILESAQMLSIVFSKHYWDIGEVMKVDGTPFKTEKRCLQESSLHYLGSTVT